MKKHLRWLLKLFIINYLSSKLPVYLMCNSVPLCPCLYLLVSVSLFLSVPLSVCVFLMSVSLYVPTTSLCFSFYVLLLLCVLYFVSSGVARNCFMWGFFP